MNPLKVRGVAPLARVPGIPFSSCKMNLRKGSPPVTPGVGKAATVEPRQSANITVTVTPPVPPDNINRISINEKVIPFENYASYLKKEIDAHPDRLVIIKADRNVRHAVVISIISTTKKLGAQRISVGTVQRT